MRAPLPTDAYGGNVELNSVSCSSAGNCTAVGSFDGGNGDHPGVLLTQTNGDWAPGVRALLPAGLWPRHTRSYQTVVLQAVSCSSPGNCTAVGTYRGVRHRAGGLLLTQTDGKWATGVPAPLPANHAKRQLTPTRTSISTRCRVPHLDTAPRSATTWPGVTTRRVSCSHRRTAGGPLRVFDCPQELGAPASGPG